MRTFTLVCLLAAPLALAASPEELAKIQHDVAKAQAEVDKKYEGRKLSSDERKQQMQERAAAENAILDKAGVDRKDFHRQSAKMSKDDASALAAEKQRLEAEDKASKQGVRQGGNEVVVEKGNEPTPEQEAAEMDKAMGFGKGKSGGGGGKKGSRRR